MGRYEIVGHLATGGMAEILLGKLVGPSGFERPVVVKRILPHLARLDEFVGMFVDEARIVAGIRHPNVVQVHELAHEGGELFLAMEYLEGESLGGLLRRLVTRRQNLDRVLGGFVIAEACAGLHAAHELTDEDGMPRDLVHRDVSPQNVFVTYDGQIKLLDFGIAKAANRSTRTEAGRVKGKFAYMSPEQCLGKPLDRRSDIFALGILLWELSTGRQLFKRASEHLTFKAICEERIVPPSEIVPDHPPELEAIMMRALARRRDDRYASALELRRDLLAWARKSGLSEVPEEGLAELMRHLFAERIEEKQEMLRRFRVGSAPTNIPVAEPDEDVELPSMIEDVSTIHSAADVHERPGRKRRWVAPFAAAFVAAGIAVAILTRASLSQQRSAPVVAAAPVASVVSTAAPPPSVQPATELAEVVLRIETTPSAARVILDGQDQGVTPLELSLPRSDTAVSFELRRAGFLPRRERVTPSMSQRLVLPLVAAPRPKPTKPKEVPRFR
jgi:eukaryotic-like serine/threonine-protein kinase